MKNNYTIAKRNAIVEEHLSCIDTVMRRNRKLIRDTRLDPDDVYQQLALRLVKAAGNYDPDKGELETYIMAQLNYELQSCLRPYRRFGVTNAPRDFGGKIISLDAYLACAEVYDQALAA